MNFNWDDGALEQFVDGELALDQRQSILRRLDEDPAHWRRLALAFVEQQMVREASRRMVDPPSVMPAAPSKRKTRWTAAVVASLLLIIGYGIGVLFPAGFSNANRRPSTHLVSPSVPDSQIAKPAPENQPSDGPRSISFEEALARCAAPVPESFRRRLLMAGYFVDEAHQITPVKLPTGEEIEVPVRIVNVRYLGGAAFQ